MTYRFEEYSVQTGVLRSGEGYYASIEEFPALVDMGQSIEEATANLRLRFDERIQYLNNIGSAIPVPSSGKAKIEFAPNDKVEALRPLVDYFWADVLGTSYNQSYVSNESKLEDWEHYISGGRAEIISRVVERFGIDISDCYDESVVNVLRKIDSHVTR
jgi:predicted RNase H-like HicB family nuclease